MKNCVMTQGFVYLGTGRASADSTGGSGSNPGGGGNSGEDPAPKPVEVPGSTISLSMKAVGADKWLVHVPARMAGQILHTNADVIGAMRAKEIRSYHPRAAESFQRTDSRTWNHGEHEETMVYTFENVSYGPRKDVVLQVFSDCFVGDVAEVTLKGWYSRIMVGPQRVNADSRFSVPVEYVLNNYANKKTQDFGAECSIAWNGWEGAVSPFQWYGRAKKESNQVLSSYDQVDGQITADASSEYLGQLFVQGRDQGIVAMKQGFVGPSVPTGMPKFDANTTHDGIFLLLKSSGVPIMKKEA